MRICMLIHAHVCMYAMCVPVSMPVSMYVFAMYTCVLSMLCMHVHVTYLWLYKFRDMLHTLDTCKHHIQRITPIRVCL